MKPRAPRDAPLELPGRLPHPGPDATETKLMAESVRSLR